MKSLLLFTIAAELSMALLNPRAASAQSTERQYLSGRDKDDTVPWRFMCTSGANSGVWTNLPVPSHWDLHGFGTLTYKKDATNAWDEHGLYEHEFTIPADWQSRRVFLVFEGVMTDTTARLNGEQVGPTHQGGFYRFKYDVTPHMKFGKHNKLEVKVARHSANESVNRAERLADYWVFAGIYRPVYLEAVPREFIERVAIDAWHDGTFNMDVFLDGVADADSLEAQIITLDGQPVDEPMVWSSAFRRPGPADDTTPSATLKTRITSPKQWTAETPNLYLVEVRLKRGAEVVHQITQRFGFRTIEVRDADGIYVNGKRVILKGVNRHSFWPDSGRCLSESVHRLDIETMKDMNMNAVRMSHYPPDVEFLDLCDELGLYVLDEIAGWHNHYNDEVGAKLVKAMVTRDVNHPSILFWDNGNEGGFNRNLDPLYAKYDPQKRRVLHPWEPFGGINTGHYLAYSTAKIAAAGEPMYYQPKANDEVLNPGLPGGWIYMPTEFLHGLYDGGAGAGLDDYWSMMTQSPLLGGGFIWVFCDEGVKRPETGEIDTAGNQAPDGIVGPYREREGSFYTIKELWSPIQVTRNADGTLTIENHYSFTDAGDCAFTWQLRRFYDASDSASGHLPLSQGELEVPSIPPGQSATVPLELPVTGVRTDALAVRVNDPHGRELWTWVWELGPDEDGMEMPERFGSPDLPRVAIRELPDAFQMDAGDLRLRISRENGMLISAQRGGRSFSLANGPRPAHGEFTLTGIDHQSNGSNAVITARYDGDLRRVVWRVSGDGWVDCEYTYHAAGPMSYHGVAFDYPGDRVESKRWLGRGPYRVWKNRLPGGTLDVWRNNYNNTITGHSGWEYPEFKGCFAGVRWMQLQTAEGPITIVPGNRDVYVQALKPEQPPDNLVGQTKFELPDAGLAVLHAIPPIGTKFKPAAQGGPQGQLDVASGEYSGSFRLCFGPVP